MSNKASKLDEILKRHKPLPVGTELHRWDTVGATVAGRITAHTEHSTGDREWTSYTLSPAIVDGVPFRELEVPTTGAMLKAQGPAPWPAGSFVMWHYVENVGNWKSIVTYKLTKGDFLELIEGTADDGHDVAAFVDMVEDPAMDLPF